MIEVKTVLTQTECPEGRNVIAYFMRVVYDNGVEIARSKGPHVVSFPPDADYNALFAAVNDNITTRPDMRWPAIEADEWARAVGHCEVEHTPEVKEAYVAWKEADQERQAQLFPPAEAEK